MWGWVELSILGSVGPLVPTVRWGMLCWSWGWVDGDWTWRRKKRVTMCKKGMNLTKKPKKWCFVNDWGVFFLKNRLTLAVARSWCSLVDGWGFRHGSRQDFFRRLAQPLNWNRSFPYTSILCRKAKRWVFPSPPPHIGSPPHLFGKGYILVLLKVSLGCI